MLPDNRRRKPEAATARRSHQIKLPEVFPADDPEHAAPVAHDARRTSVRRVPDTQVLVEMVNADRHPDKRVHIRVEEAEAQPAALHAEVLAVGFTGKDI